MPDFQYQPPTGPLSGSEFERQTTQFFQQVSAAAGAASTAASAAQTTANEALERAQASNLVDGKTTTEAGGVITVKDVAIGGNLEDLASARSLTAKFIKGLGSVDCNTIAENMIAAVYQAGTTNGPGFASVLLSFFSSAVMGVQAAFILNSSTIVRASLRSKSANGYSPWSDFLMSGRVGDGIEVNNGIPSVPEYEGATASSTGTSGLVPPAAAGQATYVLCGDGEWRDIATLVAAAQARLAESVKAEEGAL